jgi:hypothetical protein
MKKTALIAAAAALFVATPALAQAGGHVGVGYTSTDFDGDDAETVQVEGAFGSSAGTIGYQVDAGIGNTDFDGGDGDHYTVAGHLYWNGGAWRLGGVVANNNFDFGTSDVTETVYGVEGTFDLGANAVLLGSYTVGESEFLVDLDTWNADLGVNFYFADNFRVGGAVGLGNLDAGATDFDTTSYGIGGDWQPFTTPVSFTLGWNRFETDGAFDDYDSWSIGARWNFGGSLRDRDNATPFETRAGLYQRLYSVQ